MSDDRLQSRRHPARLRARRRAIRIANTLGALIFSLPVSFVLLPVAMRLDEFNVRVTGVLIVILALAAIAGIAIFRLAVHYYYRKPETT